MIHKLVSQFTDVQSLRNEMNKSRFKIWFRAFLFVQFSLLFGFYLCRDISNGHFRWEWVPFNFAFFVPIGFFLSHIVPMRADPELQAVTLSLDRVYLFLIWLLVVSKLIIGLIPLFTLQADFIMCSILGIMFGRLGGIGLRVRQLKIQHGFAGK